MFKKILSLALALMMIMSVAAIAASAAETDIAEVAAEADVAETGAGQTISFDNSQTGWAGPIQFYIYDIESGAELIPWGSKKLDGEDNGDGTWSKDISSYGIESGKQYCVLFVDKPSGSQTYDLLMDSSCIGDTGYTTGTKIENPVDSNGTCIEAKWKSSSLGPRKQITSIGNVVGDTIPSNTNAYEMFKSFLTDKLDNARQYAGKNDQQLLDDTASALGLTKDEVEKAITETKVTADWSKDKSTLKSGDSNENNNNNNNNNNNSNNNNNTGGSGSGSGSGSGNTGSASDTQTGQSETILFIMLGVMVLAAGVIFFVRKKERA